MKSLANEFFATMEQGARKHAEAHPGQYELIVNGIKDERDLARQTAIVDELIAQKVDAIVLAPADSKALVAACQRARRAGIAVVNIDNKLDDEVLAEAGLTIPFVGPDNRAGARLAADHLAKQLKSGDPVAVLEGIPTAFNGQQRKLGFDDAIAAAGLKLVSSQSGQWESAIANQVAAAVLTEHPEIRALLCANDNMALGALAAARAANRAGDLLIIGYDGIGAVREAIREGGILATVEQHADQLAVFGIEYALKLLDGETPADQQTPVELVTRENAG
jgi:ribose transport system substrate-binding protein